MIIRFNPWRFLVLIPLAYIVWWFYSLFFWLIPSLNVPIADVVHATWWGIISVILYLTLGIFALVIAFILVFIFFTEN